MKSKFFFSDHFNVNFCRLSLFLWRIPPPAGVLIKHARWLVAATTPKREREIYTRIRGEREMNTYNNRTLPFFFLPRRIQFELTRPASKNKECGVGGWSNLHSAFAAGGARILFLEREAMHFFEVTAQLGIRPSAGIETLS